MYMQLLGQLCTVLRNELYGYLAYTSNHGCVLNNNEKNYYNFPPAISLSFSGGYAKRSPFQVCGYVNKC